VRDDSLPVIQAMRSRYLRQSRILFATPDLQEILQAAGWALGDRPDG
jgi:hypothetical protein